MFATLDTINVLEHAEKLGKYISQSDIAHYYQECKNKLQQDKEIQTRIQEFQKLKEHYEEVQRFGKYHPNYSEVSTKVRVLKRELDLNETIANFKKAEKELEMLLNEISGIVAHSVSSSIKVPTGNPFFDNRSCSGGCGSGGSCGCK
ncbi:YlbF family regulator [Bacillus taeanensis]|uniref:YlbF family regulator n=1 Tax=Bacillus taeanensis TaxID=273032 RepID=A0A366Y1E1_9BACI|nr:YlbF family regulator [Bacillus taeanensis]RBW70233.1 YlbF family regulator [Bacillus taeanensis]